MPGGGFSASVPPAGVEFEAKITPIVIVSCIMAATGGLMFGYDVGVSGNFFIIFFSKFFLIKNLCYCRENDHQVMMHNLVVVFESVFFSVP